MTDKDVIAIEKALYKILFELVKNSTLGDGMEELVALKTQLKLYEEV